MVIDEIAELFLAGAGRNVKDIQTARATVSKLARQGRAVGIHLILGTQRPDARALDTQIKANLPGKVCFQMADVASSMVVLGNGRARNLPGIPGRAIWQRGLKMFEMQTPYLDPSEVDALLANFRQEKKVIETAPAPKHQGKRGASNLEVIGVRQNHTIGQSRPSNSQIPLEVETLNNGGSSPAILPDSGGEVGVSKTVAPAESKVHSRSIGSTSEAVVLES